LLKLGAGVDSNICTGSTLSYKGIKTGPIPEAHMTGNFSLIVNDAPIHSHPFVEEFIEHTISGMIEALKGTGKIKDLNLTVNGDYVTLNLNGVTIPTNAMTGKMIKNTILGMVSAIPGMEDINKLSIIVHKEACNC
jgi:hypothetical protein